MIKLLKEYLELGRGLICCFSSDNLIVPVIKQYRVHFQGYFVCSPEYLFLHVLFLYILF